MPIDPKLLTGNFEKDSVIIKNYLANQNKQQTAPSAPSAPSVPKVNVTDVKSGTPGTKDILVPTLDPSKLTGNLEHDSKVIKEYMNNNGGKAPGNYVITVPSSTKTETPKQPVQNNPAPTPQVNPQIAQMLQQLQAQQAALEAQRQQAIKQLNEAYIEQETSAKARYDIDKKQTGENYDNYRNQASVNSAMSLQALKEQMAAQGLFKSGDNITGQLNINNQRSGDIAAYNKDEQNTYTRMSADLQNLLANLNMTKSQAMLNQSNIDVDRAYDNMKWQSEQFYRANRDSVADQRYNGEFEYQKSRDSISDSRYDREWDYSVGRDNIADQRYDREWDYSVGRDKVADDRYKNEWDYGVSRDKVADSQWERQHALQVQNANRAASYSGGASSTTHSAEKGNDGVSMAWESLGNILNQGGTPQAFKWLEGNQEAIKNSIGTTEYNRMKNTVSEIVKQNTVQYRKNKNSSPDWYY